MIPVHFAAFAGAIHAHEIGSFKFGISADQEPSKGVSRSKAIFGRVVMFVGMRESE